MTSNQIVALMAALLLPSSQVPSSTHGYGTDWDRSYKLAVEKARKLYSWSDA